MTWKQFKEQAESLGVTDDMEICHIEIGLDDILECMYDPRSGVDIYGFPGRADSPYREPAIQRPEP